MAKRGPTTLADVRRDACYDSIREMPDEDLCEMIRTHFNSHPALPGEKEMREEADAFLRKTNMLGRFEDNYPELDPESKDSLARRFADTRFRETPIREGLMEVADRDKGGIEGLQRSEITKLGQNGEIETVKPPAPNMIVERVNAVLTKGDNGKVLITAEQQDGSMRFIGTLPDNFLANNPMNVKCCDAELQVTDYSNGKWINRNAKIVVDTDMMSGDILELDESMLEGLEDDNAPKR